MKNEIFLPFSKFGLALLILLLFATNTNQSKYSKDEQLQYLSSFCQVWGYMKYFMPAESNISSRINSFFHNHIDTIKHLKSSSTYNEIIHNEIKENLGEHDKFKNTFSNKDYINYSINWIMSAEILSYNNIVSLNNLRYTNLKSAENFIKADTLNLKPIFLKNESDTNICFPSESLRLEAFFNYWNKIQYFYPYLYLLHSNWETVLLKYIPLFINCKSNLQYHLLFLNLSMTLRDCHALPNSKYINNYFGGFYLPFEVKYEKGLTYISDVYSDSLARLYDFSIGDIIISINGEKSESIRKKLRKHCIGTNINNINRNINYYFVKGSGSFKTIHLKKKKKSKFINIKLYSGSYLADAKNKTHYNKVSSDNIINNKIGYIDLSKVKTNKIDSIFGIFRDLKSIIIDLRQYPYFTIHRIIPFLQKKQNIFAINFYPIINQPGVFLSSLTKLVSNSSDKYFFQGNIVLLINSNTQSRGEYFSMIFQSLPKTITIGNQSAGCDGNVVSYYISSGLTVRFSGTGIKYLDGYESQINGIKITRYSSSSRLDIINRIDRVLLDGLKFANKIN